MSLRFGVKEEELEPFSLVSFRLKLVMGEPALRCTECAGKLGPPGTSGRCEICWLLGRLRDHLLSSRFPPQGIPAATSSLRDSLLRILETSESFWAFNEKGEAQGGEPARRAKPEEEKEVKPEITARDKRKPIESSEDSPSKPKSPQGDSRLNLTPKFAAKPPDYPTAKDEELGDQEDRNTGPASGSCQPVAVASLEEEESLRQPEKKVRREKKESKKSRSRSHHKRRRRGSGEKVSSPRDRKRRREGCEEEARRSRPRPTRCPSGERRSPLRPRSPSHPPVHRKWVGPIPAGNHRSPSRGRQRDHSPRYTNKGAKKRQQQARLKGKGKGSSLPWFRRP